VQALVMRQLGATALFAGKFRENAARSLLLPKRRPGMRAPLWQQRKRAADLLAVASRYGSFPILLETYRECLRDFFDMPALVATLSDVRSGKLRVSTVDSDAPSPFARSLLFSYVASFLYDGDAPLAERRAQALAVDQTQLRELMGDAELRELLDAEAIETVERQLQHLDLEHRAKSVDAIHDMLLSIGDLTESEICLRAVQIDGADAVRSLVAAGRILLIRVAAEMRYIAIEDAPRYRDGLSVPLPSGISESLLQGVRDPLGDLARRYARTHTPFSAADFAQRLGLSPQAAEAVLTRLRAEGRLFEGEFRPGGTGREWTDADVLRRIRRRSLAKLRHEIEPVDQTVLGRFATTWQGIVRRRQGADALLDAIEQLQGAPLAASILETEILPARIDSYDAADLDAIIAAGEIVWVGVESLGERDGRVALYLADQLPKLLLPGAVEGPSDVSSREAAVLECLRSRGASFFGPLHEAVGGGYPGDTVSALWDLVWRGLVTNDTFHALRAFTLTRIARRKTKRTRPPPPSTFRSRRLAPVAAEGRWTLVPRSRERAALDSRSAASFAQQLLVRHGIVTREAMAVESIPGGFGTIYPVLKAMEEAGRLRRGYFVAGLGATQFALPAALDLLRSLRQNAEEPEVSVLSATDPANPYGATLKWPSRQPTRQGQDPQIGDGVNGGSDGGRAPTRSIGATVVLVDGMLAAYLARGEGQLTTYLPEAEPLRSRVARAVARVLIDRARSGAEAPRGMLIEEIDGLPPSTHPLASYLIDAGFIGGAMGFQPRFQHQ
jgi:ATP-dependent Lhr-like helicase